MTPTASPSPPPSPLRGGPLRNGNPRGNPALAPRCGARTRAGGCCQAPALRGRTRCRVHGGASTGPRSDAGVARIAAARTTHGMCTQAVRAALLHDRLLLRCMRVLAQAVRYQRFLPEALRARLEAGEAWELMAPPDPSRIAGAARAAVGARGPGRDARGRFVARRQARSWGEAVRAAAREREAALAPWRAAIDAARAVRRAKRAKDPLNRETGGAAEAIGGAAPTGKKCGDEQNPMDRGDGGGRGEDTMHLPAGASGMAGGVASGSPRPLGPCDDKAGGAANWRCREKNSLDREDGGGRGEDAMHLLAGASAVAGGVASGSPRPLGPRDDRAGGAANWRCRDKNPLDRGDGGGRGEDAMHSLAGASAVAGGGASGSPRPLGPGDERTGGAANRRCGEKNPLDREDGGGHGGDAMHALAGASAVAGGGASGSPRPVGLRDIGTRRRGWAGNGPLVTRLWGDVARPAMGLRARLLGGTDHDGSPFWVEIDGGLGALLAGIAAGEATDAAIRTRASYVRR